MTTPPPVKRSGDVCESVLEPVEGSGGGGEAKLPFGGRDINRRQEVHMCPPPKKKTHAPNERSVCLIMQKVC